jgi:hypothetical protein
VDQDARGGWKTVVERRIGRPDEWWETSHPDAADASGPSPDPDSGCFGWTGVLTGGATGAKGLDGALEQFGPRHGAGEAGLLSAGKLAWADVPARVTP